MWSQLKAGVRNKAPSQTWEDPCLVGVRTIIPLQDLLLEGRRRGCPVCVSWWRRDDGGREPFQAQSGQALQGHGRTSHFWLVFRRQAPRECAPPTPAASSPRGVQTWPLRVSLVSWALWPCLWTLTHTGVCVFQIIL